MGFLAFVRSHLWATAAAILAVAVFPFNLFLQWKDLVALGVPSWGWAMISIIILTVTFVVLLYQQHKRIEQLAATLDLDGKLEPIAASLASISARLGVIEGQMALVRQEAERFAEGVPIFQEEMRAAIADHVAHTAKGWADLEHRITRAPDSTFLAARQNLEQLSNELGERLSIQTDGMREVVAQAQIEMSLNSGVIHSAMLEVKSASDELDKKLSRLSPQAEG